MRLFLAFCLAAAVAAQPVIELVEVNTGNVIPMDSLPALPENAGGMLRVDGKGVCWGHQNDVAGLEYAAKIFCGQYFGGNGKQMIASTFVIEQESTDVHHAILDADMAISTDAAIYYWNGELAPNPATNAFDTENCIQGRVVGLMCEEDSNQGCGALCHPFATCEGPVDSEYKCVCNDGFTGNGEVCVSVDVCATEDFCVDQAQKDDADYLNFDFSISHVCTNTVGGNTCTCTSNYQDAAQNPTGPAPIFCEPINFCADAANHNCQYNENVYTTFDDTVTVDPCVDGLTADGSLCNQECVKTAGNEGGGFTCQCVAGFRTQVVGGNTICVDIDECAANSHTCDTVSEVCSNRIGGFVCDCAAGFEASGGACVDIKECGTCGGDQCGDRTECTGAGQTCTEEAGSFSCGCAAGYVLGGDGVCVDINECVKGPCGTNNQKECSAEITTGCCENQINAYKCNCAAGYELVDASSTNANNEPTWKIPLDGEIGGTCQEIDECATTTDPCNGNGTCRDKVGYFTCDCFTGFSGQFCDQKHDPCSAAPCLNGGACASMIDQPDWQTTYPKGYECTCTDGYFGTNCEVNVNPCATNDPCQNGGVCEDVWTVCAANDPTCTDFVNLFDDRKPHLTYGPAYYGMSFCTCPLAWSHEHDDRCEVRDLCYNEDDTESTVCGDATVVLGGGDFTSKGCKFTGHETYDCQCAAGHVVGIVPTVGKQCVAEVAKETCKPGKAGVGCTCDVQTQKNFPLAEIRLVKEGTFIQQGQMVVTYTEPLEHLPNKNRPVLMHKDGRQELPDACNDLFVWAVVHEECDANVFTHRRTWTGVAPSFAEVLEACADGVNHEDTPEYLETTLTLKIHSQRHVQTMSAATPGEYVLQDMSNNLVFGFSFAKVVTVVSEEIEVHNVKAVMMEASIDLNVDSSELTAEHKQYIRAAVQYAAEEAYPDLTALDLNAFVNALFKQGSTEGVTSFSAKVVPPPGVPVIYDFVGNGKCAETAMQGTTANPVIHPALTSSYVHSGLITNMVGGNIEIPAILAESTAADGKTGEACGQDCQICGDICKTYPECGYFSLTPVTGGIQCDLYYVGSLGSTAAAIRPPINHCNSATLDGDATAETYYLKMESAALEFADMCPLLQGALADKNLVTSFGGDVEAMLESAAADGDVPREVVQGRMLLGMYMATEATINCNAVEEVIADTAIVDQQMSMHWTESAPVLDLKLHTKVQAPFMLKLVEPALQHVDAWRNNPSFEYGQWEINLDKFSNCDGNDILQECMTEFTWSISDPEFAACTFTDTYAMMVELDCIPATHGINMCPIYPGDENREFVIIDFLVTTSDYCPQLTASGELDAGLLSYRYDPQTDIPSQPEGRSPAGDQAPFTAFMDGQPMFFEAFVRSDMLSLATATFRSIGVYDVDDQCEGCAGGKIEFAPKSNPALFWDATTSQGSATERGIQVDIAVKNSVTEVATDPTNPDSYLFPKFEMVANGEAYGIVPGTYSQRWVTATIEVTFADTPEVANNARRRLLKATRRMQARQPSNDATAELGFAITPQDGPVSDLPPVNAATQVTGVFAAAVACVVAFFAQQ